MPAPIDEAIRARIVDLARAGTSRNATARQAGVSSSTVSRVAHAAGLTFDRAHTQAGTQAAQVDARARRVAVASGLLGDVAAARVLLAAQVDAQRAMYAAKTISALVSAYARLAALDVERDDHADVDRWISHLLDGTGGTDDDAR